MANNPLNLVLRFVLELYALYAMGFWAWNRFEGWTHFLFVILIPLLAAAIWGIFRPPTESPRGHAAVPVAGWVRLLIEACFFGFAVWGLFDAGTNQAGSIFGIALIVHYALSYDRIMTLLSR
ncbi:MAG TPA: YrdB family protein [Anaerolineales bacterium]|nr:YrdB family protein [Anaerolineales bacterium]